MDTQKVFYYIYNLALFLAYMEYVLEPSVRYVLALGNMVDAVSYTHKM